MTRIRVFLTMLFFGLALGNIFDTPFPSAYAEESGAVSRQKDIYIQVEEERQAFQEKERLAQRNLRNSAPQASLNEGETRSGASLFFLYLGVVAITGVLIRLSFLQESPRE